MDILITIIGIVGSLATIFCLAVYYGAQWIANPKLILRLSNESGDVSYINGTEGSIFLGISTKQQSEVLLTKVSIQIPLHKRIQFAANDLFTPQMTPGRAGISLVWEGQKITKPKHYVMFWVPYQVFDSNQDKHITTIEISVTARIDESRWTAPWSMFSLYPRTVQFSKILRWLRHATTETTRGFRLGPRESCDVSGRLAQEAFYASGSLIDVLTAEIMKDGTYSTRRIKLKLGLSRDTREIGHDIKKG